MTATYDPDLLTARDRLRHELFDFEFYTDPVNGAVLDPDETYDALLNTYGEDEAKYRQASSFLARYGSDVSRIRDSDGSEIAWQQRVAAWVNIVENAYKMMLLGTVSKQKPLVGQMKTVAPIDPPGVVDANAQRYRGSPYRDPFSRWG